MAKVVERITAVVVLNCQLEDKIIHHESQIKIISSIV